jgi:glutaminyl-tRNA synthetase
VAAELRLYDRLFSDPEPDGYKDRDFLEFLNPDSLLTVQGWVEPAALNASNETRFQFERLGYFCADRFDHVAGEKPVFNRTVSLKDTWAK